MMFGRKKEPPPAPSKTTLTIFNEDSKQMFVGDLLYRNYGQVERFIFYPVMWESLARKKLTSLEALIRLKGKIVKLVLTADTYESVVEVGVLRDVFPNPTYKGQFILVVHDQLRYYEKERKGED